MFNTHLIFPLKVLILLFLLFFTSLYLFQNIIFAETIYLSDNFDDGYSDGWEESNLTYCGESSWQVNDEKKYGIIINSIWECKTQSILKTITIPEESYYIYELDITFSKSINMDRNFYVKYIDTEKWYGFHIVNNTIHFEKVYVGQEYTNPFPSVYYPFATDQTYHFSTYINNETITLEITNESGEKTSFHYTDTPPILPNKYVGLRASTGAITSSEVWFDNIALTIFSNSSKKLFNLPFSFTNRENPNQTEFRNAFWNKLTAAFDHSILGNNFIPFTTNIYNKKSCQKGTTGISCYDSHNGTDFAPKNVGSKDNVYPVADGVVVYASDKDKNGKCNPGKSGYGCVIIIYHSDLDVYTLYAHLSEILTSVNNSVSYQDVIGKMGNTGCGPSCGVHIHLGVMRDKTPLSLKANIKLSDWENLLKQVEPIKKPSVDVPPKHYCTYRLTNGNILSFQDPTGWSNKSILDPWSLSSELGSCATESPYLWMYDVGTAKLNLLTDNL